MGLPVLRELWRTRPGSRATAVCGASASELVAGHQDGSLSLVDRGSGAVLQAFGAHPAPVDDVRVLVTPDGTPIAVSLALEGEHGGWSVLRVWDVRAGTPFGSHSLSVSGRQKRFDAFLLADGRPVVLAVTNDPLFEVWGVAKRQRLVERSLTAWSARQPALVVTEKSGARLAVSAQNDVPEQQALLVWDVMTGELLREPTDLVPPVGAWTAFAAGDSGLVVLTGLDGAVTVERLRIRETVFRGRIRDAAVVDLAAAEQADGRAVCVTVHTDGWLHVWDARTGRDVAEPLLLPGGGRPGAVCRVALVDDDGRPGVVVAGDELCILVVER